MQKNSVLMTGGHAATSALAVIEEIQKQHPEWNVIWIGTDKAFESQKATTLDFQLFPKMGVTCYSIPAGKLQRQFSLSSLVGLFRIPLGFIQAIGILRKHKPEVVLSWGGFVAVPVVWAAKVLGIPVLLHEQTVAIGLANKLSLPATTKVLLSRKQSQQYFPKEKAILTGLPLHTALLSIKQRHSSTPQIIYITGGSRGSVPLNSAVEQSLPELTKQYRVVHQTGSLDIEKFKKLEKQWNNYSAFAHIAPLDVAKQYEKSDIVIGRAGAHTVAEVIALQKAAIFVPIPWVQLNEQYRNALVAKKYVNALILDENKLDGEKLLVAVETIKKNWKQYQSMKQSPVSKRDKGAARKIVEVMEQYVQ